MGYYLNLPRSSLQLRRDDRAPCTFGSFRKRHKPRVHSSREYVVYAIRARSAQLHLVRGQRRCRNLRRRSRLRHRPH